MTNSWHCRINREYDPATDQFLSIDPDLTSTNQPYVFTNDDPLNSSDPLGQDAFPGEFQSCKNDCGLIPSGFVKTVERAVSRAVKAALKNSLVRGFAIGALISAICVGSEGIGCALAVGGISGAGLSLTNHRVNHTKGDWQSAVVLGGLQGLTNALTGEIFSELSQGTANSALTFIFRSVPGTIILKSITIRLTGG